MLFKYINEPINLTDGYYTKANTNVLTTKLFLYITIIIYMNKYKTTVSDKTSLYIEHILPLHQHLQTYKRPLKLRPTPKLNKTITAWFLPFKKNKKKQKKRRLYINFHKWRMLKNLLRKLKIKKNPHTLKKHIKLRNSVSYQKQHTQTPFKKHYKPLKFKTKQKFNHFFAVWKQTARSYIQGESIYLRNHPIYNTHKQAVTSTFMNYILHNFIKKRLLKKFKKKLGIKSGIFIKNKCVRLNHNLATKNNRTYFIVWNNNNLKGVFLQYLNGVKQLQIQKNTTDNKITTYLTKSVQFSYKIAFFETLFKLSSNNCYDNYINNTPSLVLLFEKTRYNKIYFDKFNTLRPDNQTPINMLTSNSISNYTPVHLLKHVLTNKQQHRVYSNTTLKLHNNKNMYFYVQYILTYLENYTNKKIWLRINTKSQLNNLWINYCTVFNKTQTFNLKKLHKLINTRELLEIFVQTLITCDLKVLLFYIKHKLENTHFKNHKKILSILFDTFKKNKAALSLAGVKGFSFDIRGKVGVAGNAKKRHLFFSMGKISTTSQNLKAQWQQINIWTPTGQMGVTCLIQY